MSSRHPQETVGDRARALIGALGLEPHPEGGYFREIYRSASVVDPHDHRARRSAVTAIYFLLTAGQHSRWHRVASDEIWHFYEGDPLALYLGSPSCDEVRTERLGGLGNQGSPVRIAPAGWWQAAQTEGAYSLVGCTVAPGFDYADFSFLRDDAERVAALARVNHAFLRFV